MALTSADIAAINQASSSTGVPSGLLSAIALQESSGNPNAVSPTGATGLFQILPSTAAQPGYGVTPYQGSLTDPNANAMFAAQYLQALYARDGSWDAAIRQYSGGGYGLSDLQTKWGDTISGGLPVSGTGTDLLGPSQATPTDTSGTASTAGSGGTAGTAGTGSATSTIGAVWEIVTRSGVFLLGFALVLIAVAAMVWQSKTVKVAVSTLARTAAV